MMDSVDAQEAFGDAVDRQVELVEEDGTTIGYAPVATAHLAPAARHRAFSVVLHDGHGRMLLQIRSVAKERWPGYLANSCCGHPQSAETLVDDARTRVQEELGITVDTLTEVGRFEYHAAMPDSVWEEWELDHVLVGRIDPDRPIHPDPMEVSGFTWATALPDDGAKGVPHAPWLGHVVRVSAEHIPGFAR